MSAVIKKFPGDAARARRRWTFEITKPENEEREEVREYARSVVERYELRINEVINHARRLGEIAAELQEQAERLEREKARKISPTFEQKFRRLADEWKRDTKHLSSVDEMVLHPNYLKIIAMGEDVIPLLLRELKQKPDHWLVALNVLADHDPAGPEDTFREAVDAWLEWGRQEGHI